MDDNWGYPYLGMDRYFWNCFNIQNMGSQLQYTVHAVDIVVKQEQL